MNAVFMCICPDGLMHSFPEGADGRADRAFCGIPHEFVSSGDDDSKVCEVCAVELQVFLGVPRDVALTILNKDDES